MERSGCQSACEQCQIHWLDSRGISLTRACALSSTSVFFFNFKSMYPFVGKHFHPSKFLCMIYNLTCIPHITPFRPGTMLVLNSGGDAFERPHSHLSTSSLLEGPPGPALLNDSRPIAIIVFTSIEAKSNGQHFHLVDV